MEIRARKLVNDRKTAVAKRSRIDGSNRRGVLRTFKDRLGHNRMGELLVAHGLISSIDLREALALQKSTHQPLGKILRRQGRISGFAMRRILAEQVVLRCVATFVAVFIAISCMAGIKPARAGTVKDIPASVSVLSGVAASVHAPLSVYPALFGSEERTSTNIRPFTKWSGMFERFDRAMRENPDRPEIADFLHRIAAFRGMPLRTMAQKVNDTVNARPYILDNRNWGQTDYWATPVEFLERGGDCEDFAIAKYTALRALGVPEERLRLAIVHDKEKNIPHAVLVVYEEGTALILDNQTPGVRDSSRVGRYRPIFSINRTAWWLHTAPGTTVVASAD